MTLPAVVFGGPSDEHDISILTGLQVSHALKDVHRLLLEQGRRVVPGRPGFRGVGLRRRASSQSQKP